MAEISLRHDIALISINDGITCRANILTFSSYYYNERKCDGHISDDTNRAADRKAQGIV